MKHPCVILLGLSGLLSAALPSSGEELTAASSFPPAAAVIFNSKANITKRLSEAHQLGRALTRAQIAELYAFLNALPGPQEANLAGLNVLKNDLVSLLQEQIDPPAGLTSTLIAVYQNPAQDPVARDYALQHLVTWAEQGAADAPDATPRIRAVLRQAAQENTSVAGTALLGLHRLSVSDPCAPPPLDSAPSGEEISQMALRLLLSAQSPPAARITAIQVCAEREVTEALPPIQTLAQTESGTAVRISAIAALGSLGGPEQAVLLQRLAAQPNPDLRPALEGALRRLHSRLRNNPALTQNSL
jgi:hypothetical protein